MPIPHMHWGHRGDQTQQPLRLEGDSRPITGVGAMMDVGQSGGDIGKTSRKEGRGTTEAHHQKLSLATAATGKQTWLSWEREM